MIELPPGVVPNAMQPALIDFGGVQRPSSGAAALRLNRPGNRYRCAFSIPPTQMNGHGRVIVSRLIRAKSEGLRLPFELTGVSQGSPGQPVVDGAGQAGMTLSVRGLTPHYTAREGYWMSVVTAGQHYLHNIAGNVSAGDSGRAALPLSEMLRTPFPDGATIHLGKPMIEGLVVGDEQVWSISLAHHLSIEFEIEEAT